MQAQHLDTLRVADSGDLAAPVRSLLYVSAADKGSKHNVLVFGGQAMEMPDVLTVIPLHSLNEVRRVQCMGWYYWLW